MTARAPSAILRHATATPTISLRHSISLQRTSGRKFSAVANGVSSWSDDLTQIRTQDTFSRIHNPFEEAKHQRSRDFLTRSLATRGLSGKPALAEASESRQSLHEDDDEEDDDKDVKEKDTAASNMATIDTAVRSRNPFDDLAEGYTPGQAMCALMRKVGGKRAQVKQVEFSNLCLAARDDRVRDAVLIRRALQHFRDKAKFQINPRTATDAMECLLRAGTLPRSGPLNSNQKIEKALAAAHAFADHSTGLYYAAPTATLDTTLEMLLEGVREANLSLSKHADQDVKDSDEETAVNSDQEGNVGKAEEVLRATCDIVALLIRRGNRPENRMKKRAARKYLNKIQIEEGLTPSTTLQLAVQIALDVGGVEQAQELVVGPFVRWAQSKLPEDVIAMMKAAREAEAHAAQAAAETEEATGADGGEVRSDKEEGVLDKSEGVADNATEEETPSKQ